jgi:TonB family protein
MPITGNSADLSLLDLIQANVLVRNTCRITVAGPAGSGVIFLADGSVVHAVYGSLEGRDAFFALVGAGDLFFQVETGFKAPRRTVHEKWENLALEAMRLKDEGKLPLVVAAAAPAPVTAPPAPVTRISVVPPAPAAVPPSRPLKPVAPRPARRTPQRLWLAAGLGALAVAAAAGGYFALAQRPAGEKSSASVVAKTSASMDPIEASELTQPGDKPPVLIRGTPPPSPLPDLALRPTIVCRILIGVNGEVQQAQVYQSRLDLAPFEAAALDAVRTYRFDPAYRNGAPVPVWINWPVSFE